AALHLGERQSAEKRLSVRRENEEGVAAAVSNLALVALDSAPEGHLGQVVGGPDRLPGREEGAAVFAQLRPLRIVRKYRRAQQNPVAADGRRGVDRRDRTQARHGPPPQPSGADTYADT